MELEKWKVVKNADNYEISTYGNIRRASDKRILVQSIDRYGYPKIHLKANNGFNWYTTIHRVVALNWLYVPSYVCQVNHKDGVKTNNHGCPWYPYTEEIIVCNRFNKKYIVKVFLVTGLNLCVYAFRFSGLLKLFNIDLNTPHKLITLKYLRQLSGIPHLDIVRLNKPITVNKDKDIV